MDLADRLLFLALGADNNGWVMDGAGRPDVPPVYRRGAAAGLLAELALRRRVRFGARVAPLDATTTGDPELDNALGVVLPGELALQRCVAAVTADRPDLARLRRLHGAGLLHDYTDRGRRMLFVRETSAHLEQVLRPLHAALRRGRCDEPTRALLALLRPTGLHRRWLRGLPPAERDRRLRALLSVDRGADLTG